MRILYTNFDNHFIISAEDSVKKNLLVSIDEGEISLNDDSLTIRISGSGRHNIYMVLKSTGDTLYNSGFISDDRPYPTPLIAGKTGGEISLKDITDAGSINMINKTELIKLPDYKICGFTLAVFTGMGMKYYMSSSEQFTQEQLNIISEIKPGQKFLLQDITVKKEGPEVFNIGTISLSLKKEEEQ